MVNPQLVNTLMGIVEQPEVQADIATVEKWIVQALEAYAIQAEPTIKQLLGHLGVTIIKKIKGMFFMSEENTNATQETNVNQETATQQAVNTAEQTIVDAAKTAVITAATTEISTTNPVSLATRVIAAAYKKVAELEAEENGGSKSWYVKDVRDPFEVIGIKALVVLAAAGSGEALIDLQKKLGK